jgi:hypothetical protein
MGTALLGKQLVISHNLGNFEYHSIALFAQLLVQLGGIIHLERMGHSLQGHWSYIVKPFQGDATLDSKSLFDLMVVN